MTLDPSPIMGLSQKLSGYVAPWNRVVQSFNPSSRPEMYYTVLYNASCVICNYQNRPASRLPQSPVSTYYAAPPFSPGPESSPRLGLDPAWCAVRSPLRSIASTAFCLSPRYQFGMNSDSASGTTDSTVAATTISFITSPYAVGRTVTLQSALSNRNPDLQVGLADPEWKGETGTYQQ